MGVGNLLLQALLHPNETKAMVGYKIWRDPLNSIEKNPQSGYDRESGRECWRMLDLTSRSFSAVIKELEGDLSRVVAIFYLILRGLDTIEDDMTISIEKKEPLLLDFHKFLEIDGWTFNESGPNEKDAHLLREFHWVVEEYKLLEPGYKEVIDDMTKKMGAGMARYAKLHAESGGKFSVDTLASFDLYCHYVAGLVGEGLSRLFSASGKEAKELGEQMSLSNSMGLFLQKTNITRDFREDCDEGRVFWPAEIWSKYVDKAEDLHAKGNEEKALWAMSEMIVDALTHVTDALDYLTLLTNQSVFNFCAIPQVMAIATLDACFMNPNVFHKNVKIRKGTAVELIMGSSNPRDVAYLFRDYARKIHSRARAADPSFIKIAVLAGRIEQWTENRYPSFVQLGKKTVRSSADWEEGMDVRIKQLGEPSDEEKKKIDAYKRATEGTKMSTDDMKFMFALIGATIGALLAMCAVGGGLLWYFVIREGAYFGGDDVLAARMAAHEVTESVKQAAITAARSGAPKVEL